MRFLILFLIFGTYSSSGLAQDCNQILTDLDKKHQSLSLELSELIKVSKQCQEKNDYKNLLSAVYVDNGDYLKAKEILRQKNFETMTPGIRRYHEYQLLKVDYSKVSKENKGWNELKKKYDSYLKKWPIDNTVINLFPIREYPIVLYKTSHFEDALKYADLAVSALPKIESPLFDNDIGPMIEVAILSAYKASNFQRALEFATLEYRRVGDKLHSDPKLMTVIAISYMGIGDLEKADSALTTLIHTTPAAMEDPNVLQAIAFLVEARSENEKTNAKETDIKSGGLSK